jgi:drug/metabolite transporter (DMT)-like permease
MHPSIVFRRIFCTFAKDEVDHGAISVSHENRHHRIVWMKHKGIICGMLSAICYGTNPFGALPLYEEGVNTASVLFYRFSMAVVILFVMLMMGRQSMRVQKNEIKVLSSLGFLMAIASITFYQSFHYMDAGIASTILFVYSVMVAVIMSVFFKESITLSTISAIILALLGVVMLYHGGGTATLST